MTIKLFTFIISCIFLLFKYNNLFEGWLKYEFNPVLGDNNTGSVFDPCVIKHENLFKMYISWRKYGSIAITTSKDGINWSNLKIILSKGNKTSWESIINRASIIELNNTFYLWYTGQYNGKSQIGLAISKNGYDFIKYKNNPIIKPEKDYERKSVMNPHIIFDKEEKIFKMWYSAGETYEPDVICYAKSKDGIKWRKYEKNPIFNPNIKKYSLDHYKIGGCDVHKITNKKYLMFYIGYSDINTARIFVATNKNGINKWKRSNDPIIKLSKGKFDNSACYKPSAFFDKKNNKWMLWYNGRNKNQEYIGLATHKNFQLIF